MTVPELWVSSDTSTTDLKETVEQVIDRFRKDCDLIRLYVTYRGEDGHSAVVSRDGYHCLHSFMGEDATSRLFVLDSLSCSGTSGYPPRYREILQEKSRMKRWPRLVLAVALITFAVTVTIYLRGFWSLY